MAWKVICGWATHVKFGRMAPRNSDMAVHNRPTGPATLCAWAVQEDLEPVPWGGRQHGWERGLKGQSPRQPSKAIPGKGVTTDGASLRVLGEEAPEQHKLSPEEVST